MSHEQGALKHKPRKTNHVCSSALTMLIPLANPFARYGCLYRTASDLPCPTEWSSWLSDAQVVPDHLVPSGSNDITLLQGEGDVMFQLGRTGFGGSTSTTVHS